MFFLDKMENWDTSNFTLSWHSDRSKFCFFYQFLYSYFLQWSRQYSGNTWKMSLLSCASLTVCEVTCVQCVCVWVCAYGIQRAIFSYHMLLLVLKALELLENDLPYWDVFSNSGLIFPIICIILYFIQQSYYCVKSHIMWAGDMNSI